MANQVEPTLTKSLFENLQREKFVTISTVDHETAGPSLRAISWVFAPNQEKVFFAIDNRSRVLQNIKKNPLIVLNMIANESTYAIYGEATIKIEKLEEVPLKLALIEISVKEVRDVMFYGSKISAEPKYEKTYDAEAAAKLDCQVMNAIKKA
ncbi:pyridoxamine 5'-phosphate oxidase family protein [Bacillus sp. DJP31]|uniref:pyridoxamine 5'-phosphate oxidase family protein n=1 Tax=Bacillus sp. DJP31 TaxID=3409789 RepID=UPI003BB78D39